MKRIISFFAICAFVIGTFLFFNYEMETRSNHLTRSLLSQKNILEDISYKGTSKSLLDSALNLHDVHFVHLSPLFHIRKLTLKQLSDQDLNIQAEGIEFSLSEWMQNREEDSLLSAFRNYQSYLDILREPLISLFLSGYDHISADAALTLHTNPITAEGKMSLFLIIPKGMNAQLTFELQNLPPHFTQQLITQFLKNKPLPLSSDTVKEITLATEDTGFIKNYQIFTNKLTTEKKQQARHHNPSIYTYFSKPQGSLRMDYDTFQWVLKSAFYKREKSNK